MAKFVEVDQDQFENVYGFYVNNPNRESIFYYLGNSKNIDNVELNEVTTNYYFQLISSLISDYYNGVYRNIPIKTIIYLMTMLYSFLTPRKSFVDKIPLVTIVKKVGLITMVINSVKTDLDTYAIWKSNQQNIEEI